MLWAGLTRGPLGTFDHLGALAAGRIVRTNLGLTRPYVITEPAHVQHVLRDHPTTYRRDGMMWNAIRRLLGDGIITDGPTWEPRRANVAPLFAGKRVAALTEELADTVNHCVDEIAPAARTGKAVDMGGVMSTIAGRAFNRTLFGGRMSEVELRRFTTAIETAFRSVAARIVLPFVPPGLPLPGDKAFQRSVRGVDDIVLPMIRRARGETADRPDVISALLAARDPDGRGLRDVDVRDDAVSMFAAGFETSAVALTWLWVVLANHPRIAAELQREVDDVVGTDRPGPAHLADLRFTRMVIHEVLRLYAPGWIIPRVATVNDVIDGTRIEAGHPVVISPYLTHRVERVWPRPREFDPQRFTPEAMHERHRFAFIPFGGGPHACIGNHFFMIEAQLAVAAVLSRFRPRRRFTGVITPAIGASLRPRQRVMMALEPK